MDRRDQWRPVLEAQVKHWSSKSCDQLIAELTDEHCYEIEFGGTKYQVEILLLENTDKHVQVAVAVDDGTVPSSFAPLSTSFTRQKADTSQAADH
jgi:hypothetical protein